MNASQAKHKGFRLDTLFLLAGFAALLLFALWAGVGFQLAEENQNIRQEGQARSQAMVRTFAEHCNYILRQADHATHLFQALYGQSNGALTLNNFVHNELNSAIGGDVVSRLYLLDAQGNMLESSSPQSAQHTFSNSHFFQTHVSRKSLALLVDTPVIESNAQSWMIQMSRRLQSKDGSFAGVILVEIDPLYLVDQYDYSDLSKQGSLVLRNVNNDLSVERVGHNLTRSKMQVQITPMRIDGDRMTEEKVDVVQRFDTVPRRYNVRELPEFGVQALVGLPIGDTQQRFKMYQQMYFGYASAVSLLIIVGTTFLTQQTLRSRRNMRAARDAEAILSSAAEGSLDAFYILRCVRDINQEITDFVITHVNQRGANILGIPAENLRGKLLCATLPRFRDEGYFARYVQVVATGEALEEEYELNVSHINARWIHHQIVIAGDGVAITVRDITARKNAELETRNNRNFLQSLIDYLPVLVSVTASHQHGDGKIKIWNQAAQSLSGFSAQDVLGKSPHDAFPSDMADTIQKRELALLNGTQKEYRSDEIVMRRDGSVCYLHTVAVPLCNENGQIDYILCIAEDVTLRREHEQQLRKSQAELAAVNDASPLGLIGADRHGMCTYANLTFEKIAGIKREQALGDGWMAAIFQEDRTKILTAFNHLTESQTSYQGIFRFLHSDGKLIWASVKIAAIRVEQHVEGFVGSVDDITHRREAEMALRESESRLRTITNTMPAMVAYLDAQERFRFYNKAYGREIGINMEGADGKTVLEVVGPERYHHILPYIRRVLAGEVVEYEDDVSRDGVFRVLLANYIPQYAEDGKTVIGFHVMRQDITAQKLEEQRLLQLAQLDVLTGLSNRAGFMQKLRDAMTHCRQHGGLIGLMYMDIDFFKAVNDTHGHHVGDLLLTAFAQRLCHCLRAVDSVARLGGDEFTVIMHHLARPEDAHAIADKVVQIMQQSFVLEELELKISASIGLAFFAGGDASAEALMNQADMMLYSAKRNGRNTWRAAALVMPEKNLDM